MIIRELITKLGFNIDDKAFNQAEGKISELKNSFLRIGGIVGTALAPVALWKFTKAAVDAGDKVNDLAKRTGLSTSALQSLGYVANQSGVSLETIILSFKRLSQVIVDAKDGQKESIKSLTRLGISTTDLYDKNLSLEEIFLRIGDQLSRLSSDTDRMALAQDIFGRGGLELIPIFREGRKGIDELINRYKTLGAEITPEAIKMSDEFNDTLLDLRLTFASIRNSIVADILPSLISFMKKLIPVIISVKNLIKTPVVNFFKLLGKYIVYGVNIISILAKTLDNILYPFGGLKKIIESLIPLFGTLIATMAVSKFISLFKGFFDISSVLSSISRTIWQIASGLILAHAPLLLWIAGFTTLGLLIDDIIAAWRGAESLFSNIKWIDKIADKLAPIVSFFSPRGKAIVTAPYKEKAIENVVKPEVASAPVSPMAERNISINSSPVINVNGAREPNIVADEIVRRIQDQLERDRRQASLAIKTKVIE